MSKEKMDRFAIIARARELAYCVRYDKEREYHSHGDVVKYLQACRKALDVCMPDTAAKHLVKAEEIYSANLAQTPDFRTTRF